MNLETIIKVKSNPLLERYIRENSYWYKLLNRNPSLIKNMEDEMKKNYKLRFEDKIEGLNTKVNMIKAFMDALK